MTADRPHPDRAATTLAVRAHLLGTEIRSPDAPAAGSDDARVDLKLLTFRARRMLGDRPDPATAARFAAVDTPGLLCGAIQDGTARGVMVALEEAMSLVDHAEPPRCEEQAPDDDAAVFEGRDLRRKKDILVASAGARIRWSRKGGVLFVDRDHDVHAEDCVRFEDRSDRGDLDGFVADPDERPRLFSPAFLKPVRLAQGARRDHLVLEGRLGRTKQGFPCRIDCVGDKTEPFVRVVVHVRNEHDDHRLRIRFLGCADPAAIDSDGTPGTIVVPGPNHRFVAATLVRAIGRLRVGDAWIPTPGAQCHGWHRHEFRLGGRRWDAATH